MSAPEQVNIDRSALDGDELLYIGQFESDIAGLEDCFDGIERADTPELSACAGLLRDWWVALDTLDANLDTEPPPSPAAAFYLYFALHQWFEARQSVLHAIAERAGIFISRPDHGDDGVSTSNNARGYYGFSDPDLEDRFRSRPGGDQ